MDPSYTSQDPTVAFAHEGKLRGAVGLGLMIQKHQYKCQASVELQKGTLVFINALTL